MYVYFTLFTDAHIVGVPEHGVRQGRADRFDHLIPMESQGVSSDGILHRKDMESRLGFEPCRKNISGLSSQKLSVLNIYPNIPIRLFVVRTHFLLNQRSTLNLNHFFNLFNWNVFNVT